MELDETIARVRQTLLRLQQSERDKADNGKGGKEAVTELELVNLAPVIQNVQHYSAIAIMGGVVSLALWFYLGMLGKTTVAKKR